MRAVTCLLIALTLTPPISAMAQDGDGYGAMVKRATAETASGLQFKVWVEKQTLNRGQDIIIDFEVENRSNKSIYLVNKEGKPEIAIEDGETILLQAPLPWPTGHGGYNYSFTEIKQGKIHRGRLTVPSETFGNDERQDWYVKVAFGYVTDITALNRKPSPTEDPAILRNLLNSRIKVVALGGLRIEIKMP